LIPCDYPLVHNIIYGAIEFAEDFGFFPHKDFKTTQYILEEDDDRVELIDIEFGKEGKPFYFVGPNEDPVKQSKILATLERTAGPGNFDFVAGEDAFGNEEEDLEYQEDDWDGIWEDETDMRKFFLESELIDIQDGKRDPEYIQTYVIIQHKYNLLKKDKPSSIGINMPRDLDIKNLFDDYLTEDEKYLPQNGKEQEILEKFIDPELPEPTEKEAEELEKAIDEHPHLFELYMLRIWLHDLFGFKLKDNFGENFLKKFPDEPYSKIIEAFKLCSKNDVEGALHIFKNKHLIQEAFPERNGEFTEMEILYFMALMCKCYTAKEDIASAKVFAQTIIKFGEETDLYTVVGLNDLMEYMIKAVGNAKSI
ncbi:MAG: hypothetical protein ACRDE2_04565, partial [Chitinophagaceae bacterium]